MLERVFITGYSAVSPIGTDSKSTWSSLLEGQSGVDYISSFETDGLETTFAAEVDNFDPDPFVGKKQA